MAEDIIKDIKENIEKAVGNIGEAVKEIGDASDKIEGEVEDSLDEADKIKEVAKEIEPKNLAKKAEAESLSTEMQGTKSPTLSLGGKDLEERKKELLKKAAELKKKLGEEAPKTEELKEKVKGKRRTDMLIPLEEYVKAGIYLGTRVVTPDMKPFVYRRRADGLAIFNTDLIDEKIKEAIEFLSKFNAEDIILVCKRQAGWKAARMFGELTGVRVFTKKYPAGILTNTQLEDFFENELTIVTDAWLDKNALKDTLDVHKKILMICDTNNFSKGATQVIIGNNKSAKSLGVIFYLLARGYCRAKGIEKDIPDLDWWTGDLEGEKGAKYGV